MDKLSHDERVALWSGIEAFVTACGGSTNGPPTSARMNAVVLVERAAEAIGHGNRRDYFAAHAPRKVPTWFRFTPGFPAPERPPLVEELIGPRPGEESGLEAAAWNAKYNAAFAAQEPERKAYVAAYDEYRDRCNAARLVAWRYAFADMMLEQRGR